MKYINITPHEVLASSRNLIVVDIQPHYSKFLEKSFEVSKFIEFFLKQKKILYFHNGLSLGADTKSDIIDYLIDHATTEDMADAIYDKCRNALFIDKGYGFFRSWMDLGVTESNIIKVLRELVINKVSQSSELEDLESLLGDDYDEFMVDDELYLPSEISLSLLKKFSGSYMLGGGEHECLKEVELFMNAFNIKYKLIKKFIY